MSLSSRNITPEDEDFVEIQFCPRPKATQARPEKENDTVPEAITVSHKDLAEPEKEKTPAESEEKQASPSAEDATDKQETKAPEKEDKPAPKEPTSKEKKNHGALSILFDTLLVIILLAILGVGGWYIKQQMDIYRVPTAMEIALQENQRLQRERTELIEAYNLADEQIAMQTSLSHLRNELGKILSECSAIEQSIANNKNSILAMQHQIRTADREYHSIALSLLPGMSIGDATTTRGSSSLRDAYIYRVQGQMITLRSPEGQITIPIRNLVKTNLPRLARYAFGEEELVDMSDFDSNGSTPAGTTPQAAQTTPAPQPAAPRSQSYEPTSGAPVVDTTSGSTISAPEDIPTGRSTETWVPTEGELPF